ncbi:hypothetical protein GQ54DRAFT_249647, partial [Martensiomyces pterosporus]
MSIEFSRLGPTERIKALKEIIASLSSYELAIARKELLRQGSVRFDVISCLPTEVALRVFRLLNMASLRACRRTCRTWREYALSKSLVEAVVESASVYSKIPPLSSGPLSVYRWLEEREWRWENARPAFARTVDAKSKISALAVNGSWVAASYDRFLRVWKADGVLRLCLNVRANSANRISICTTARAVMFSSYLREAKIYSLVDSELLFEARSATVPIDQVDLRHDWAAVLKRNSHIEVYRWKDRVLDVRFAAGHIQVCDIKLCSNDLLVAATADWQILVFSIKERAQLY